jgi:hypothetical protein
MLGDGLMEEQLPPTRTYKKRKSVQWLSKSEKREKVKIMKLFFVVRRSVNHNGTG